MANAGFLIYSGVMPLIKTFLAIICGYVIVKMNLFPPAASRGASMVTMNVALPCLIFANVVPAFTPSNISALGPLFLIAFTYQLIGAIAGLIIREFCYVPLNFWQGIVVLTAMSNWGNLPNAVVLSVTQQAPFDPKTDPALGVSFVSIFIVSNHIAFWLCGAAPSIAWDFLPGVPQGADAEQRVAWREKPLRSFIARHILKRPLPTGTSTPATATLHDDQSALEKGLDKDKDKEKGIATPMVLSAPVTAPASPNASSPDLAAQIVPALDAVAAADPESKVERAYRRVVPTAVRRALARLAHPLGHMVNPIMISIAVSLPVALVPPLKALFVDASASGGPTFSAPDGRPPLAFLIDTGDFVGNIAVPLGLILLGASFARIKAPRPLSRLPLAAMFSVAAFKMAILPVIGIFIVQGMVRGGLIDDEAKIEKFVAMFLGGTPAAVNQLIVTISYSPDGNADILSAFILVQYLFMFLSSSVLTVVALLLL